MVDTLALVPYAITDLRTEIEEPSAYIAAEIQVHQNGQFHVVQVPVGVSGTGVVRRPAAVLIVQLHLKMAVFVSGVAENETSVAA